MSIKKLSKPRFFSATKVSILHTFFILFCVYFCFCLCIHLQQIWSYSYYISYLRKGFFYLTNKFNIWICSPTLHGVLRCRSGFEFLRRISLSIYLCIRSRSLSLDVSQRSVSIFTSRHLRIHRCPVYQMIPIIFFFAGLWERRVLNSTTPQDNFNSGKLLPKSTCGSVKPNVFLVSLKEPDIIGQFQLMKINFQNWPTTPNCSKYSPIVESAI